jgi:hypothetical protein
MRYWLQYHNYDRLGYLPSGYKTHVADLSTLDTSGLKASCVSTSKQAVRDAIGDVAFMIVGYGTNPKRYLLWSWLTIEHVRDGADTEFDAYGKGRVLSLPPELSGPEFEQFKSQCGRFGFGFQEITNSPFLPSLISLAEEFGGFRRRGGSR